MKVIKKYIKIFIKLFKANVMAEMEYKENFITSIIMVNIWLAINIVFFKSTYSMVEYIGNWNESQALFFVATFNVADNIFFLFFFRGLLGLQQSVNSGTYDYTLLKPASSVYLTCFSTFDITRIMNVIFSSLLFVYTIQDISFQPIQMISFILMIGNGVIIYAALFTMISAISFYFINSYNAVTIFFDVMEFARMPSTIISGTLKGVFMFVVPILFIAGIPSEFLFSQNNLSLVLKSSVVTIIFGIIAVLFYKISEKKYSSASS